MLHQVLSSADSLRAVPHDNNIKNDDALGSVFTSESKTWEESEITIKDQLFHTIWWLLMTI